MIRKLLLSQFRGFSRFELERLGRVNLLMGGNNSGKTSILEAVELLLAHGDPRTIWTSLSRRGERVFGENDSGANLEYDISHLFNGHEPGFGNVFSIFSENDVSTQRLLGQMMELRESPDRQELPLEYDPRYPLPPSMGLHLAWGSNETEENTVIPLTDRLGVSIDFIRRRMALRSGDNRLPLAFVTTDSLSEEDVVAGLSSVVLDPDENFVLKALRIIDPSLERIAPVVDIRNATSQLGRSVSRGGVVVKSSNHKGRIPIGTMGDGIWHLLSLALSLVRARGGVLLVDEIDTGLHFSVMQSMWKLICETAAELGVQIFATTHSSDCWKSLAALCASGIGYPEEVTIHRIERERAASVPFSAAEIAVAAERDIEIR
jgi:energy-coupling factor transporter ATP-binding protein EcfA2